MTDPSNVDRFSQPTPPTPLTAREHTPNTPNPNQGTTAATQHPQTQPEEDEQQPIPNQQEEDEKLTEYLVKEEGYVRPAAESELARDRKGVVAKKKQFDQEQQAKDKQKPSPLQQGQQPPQGAAGQLHGTGAAKEAKSKS